MAQPDLDMATELDAVVAALTLGTNLFAGPVRPYSDTSTGDGGVPIDAVFCLQRGGRSDEPLKGPVLRHLSFPSVQIVIRTGGSFQVGQTLAEEIFEALNHKPTVDYVEWFATSSVPFYLGTDDDEQYHQWSINIDTIIDEVVL